MHPTRCLPILILVLIAAGCGERAARAADKTGGGQQLETRLKKLRADRVKMAEKAKAASQAAYETETGSLYDVVWAVDALWKAKLDVANNAKERIAAHSERVTDLWNLQQKIEFLFMKGKQGGEADKMARIEYCLADAETALVAACIAEGQPYPAALVPLQTRVISFDQPMEPIQLPEAGKQR